MPTISLRLTEEEHAALKAWAHDSRRSIQKEAVFRLFDAALSERAASGAASQSAEADAYPNADKGQGSASPAVRSENVAVEGTPDSVSPWRASGAGGSLSDEVKPDWKSGKK